MPHPVPAAVLANCLSLTEVSPITAPWRSTEPETFQDALNIEIARHGDNTHRLHKAITAAGYSISYVALTLWSRGIRVPERASSIRVVSAIERHYNLRPGYLVSFAARTPKRRIKGRRAPRGVRPRRLSCHLPDDFEARSAEEQAQILHWVKTNILGGTTAYRRYHAEASRQKFSLNFDAKRDGHVCAPQRLRDELQALISFKSAVLTDLGFERKGVWGPETIAQRKRHLALLFGALAADPEGAAAGRGIPVEHLTMAMLVFPEVWDWYVRWRERRRGFYTTWEVDMLLLGAGLTRPRTGWLRQAPWLVEHLHPVAGLISAEAVARAKANWDSACDRALGHISARARDIERVRRVHRDPFEAILPILEADNPVGEYRKIAHEILRRMPDSMIDPLGAAEASRALLMIRFGLHLGLRSKNLRQLLFCPPGAQARSEGRLEALGRGELRWSETDKAWEIFIPCQAFKNKDSAYFSRLPFKARLPDVESLYDWIRIYTERDRPLLLNGVDDPGEFFLKTVDARRSSPSFGPAAFYKMWQSIIQRYGIYNPWTGQGAIPGLMPHGPHNVRDVLATHVLKKTGSYEQAGFAIQDTARTAAAHYARFHPEDKSTLISKVLNDVWHP